MILQKNYTLEIRLTSFIFVNIKKVKLIRPKMVNFLHPTILTIKLISPSKFKEGQGGNKYTLIPLLSNLIGAITGAL